MSGVKAKKALIVEDEPTIRSVCQRVLSKEGFAVTTVGDGKAAQESVKNQQYNLLLVDIKLPVMSGIDFYVWLRGEYPQLSRRVILMTGSVMGGETMSFLEQSGQPYLLKPFRPEELVKIFRKTLCKAKG